jgi:hypothetical protein
MKVGGAIVLLTAGLLLIVLLDRWIRRRPEKDYSEGSYDHWSDGQVRSGDGHLGD